METNTKLTSAKQDRLHGPSLTVQMCAMLEPQCTHSSRISVQMDASPLGSFYHCTIVYQETQSGLYIVSNRIRICHAEVRQIDIIAVALWYRYHGTIVIRGLGLGQGTTML